MSRILSLACVVAVLGLSACAAPVPWSNPNLPKERWSADWSECRRLANEQAGVNLSANDEDDGPIARYGRSRMKAQVDGYSGMCMRERGYYPAQAGR